MNVDAAVNNCNGQIGIEIVVRNSVGMLVFVVGLCSSNVASAAVAQTKAILLGAQLAARRGLFPLYIEFDALNVVNLYEGASFTRCDLGNIIHDIKVICNSDESVSISFIPRSSNMVAHNIAK
ncbi:hypothetical protein ACOSQ3_007401 [Xanthoceras sorbifolium]